MWVLTRATGRRPRWIHKREFYVWISLSHLKILFHHLQARKNMSTAEKTSTFMSKVGDFCKTDLRHHGWLSPRTLLMLDHFWKQGFRKCFFFLIFFFLHWSIIALQLLCCVLLVLPYDKVNHIYSLWVSLSPPTPQLSFTSYWSEWHHQKNLQTNPGEDVEKWNPPSLTGRECYFQYQINYGELFLIFSFSPSKCPFCKAFQYFTFAQEHIKLKQTELLKYSKK